MRFVYVKVSHLSKRIRVERQVIKFEFIIMPEIIEFTSLGCQCDQKPKEREVYLLKS